MQPFKISDVQELFERDLDQFYNLTRNHLTVLLSEASLPTEVLEDARRQAHSLKGLAATVHAWGLSCWGADLEQLFELAESLFRPDRDQANAIFQFVQDHLEDWYVMNQLSLLDSLPEAWEHYLGLRALTEQQWPGYLPEINPAAFEADPAALRTTGTGPNPEGESSGASRLEPITPSVTDPDADFESADQCAPADELLQPGSELRPARPTPLHLVPPQLRGLESPEGQTREQADLAESDQAPEELDRPLPRLVPAPPKPLNLKSPELRRLDQSSATTGQSASAGVERSNPSQDLTRGLVPARPKPLNLLPPKLRKLGWKEKESANEPPRELQSSSRPSIAPSTAATPPAQPMGQVPSIAPPMVEVTPPPLKRLGKRKQAPNAAQAPVVARQDAPPTGSGGEDAQSEFLEMLRQEVEGYLQELSANLLGLAGNLLDQARWEDARRIFHTIKGTAATFHLDVVSAPAKAAEARCIVAVEEDKARTAETFEVCLERAQAVAGALGLTFDEQPLRAALASALGQSQVAASSALQPQLDAEMVAFFVQDANDQVGAIEQAVLRWEKQENPKEQLWAAQRAFHTLKGAANSIGLVAVAKSLHGVEAYLEGVADHNAVGTPALFEFLLAAVDQLRGYLLQLTASSSAGWSHDWDQTLASLVQPAAAGPVRAREQAPVPEALSPSKTESGDEDSKTIRIEASGLHELVNLIGELVIDRKRVEIKVQQLSELKQALNERNNSLRDLVQSFQQQFEFNLLSQRTSKLTPGSLGLSGVKPPRLPGQSGADEFSELEFDRYDQFNVLARSLVEISHDVGQLNEEMADCLHAFEAESIQFQATSDQLQEQATKLSLVPVNSVFPRLKRVFRDALHVEQKEADLIVDGGDVMLDKVVVDKIYAPLMHLLRNAVSHGIETAATRQSLGKTARGTVRLSTAQISNQIVITLSDDGTGIQSEAVRKRAIEKGWMAADAPPLTTDQVLRFIFQPGFSTALKVTSISGRGVGLDVVRQDIENLNGSVELTYEPNRGSTWTLRLPLTLSISEAIMTETGDLPFAFPMNFVEAGIILEQPVTRDENGRETYPVGETVLPLIRLSEVLRLPGNAAGTNGVVLAVGGRRAIVVVDRVIARQEIVNKQLDSLTARHPLLNGATLSVDGRVIPILNLPGLLKFSERANQVQPAALPTTSEIVPLNQQLRVLIVDDSLSVRKVQERYLRDLGCQVTAAVDGLHALETLRKGKFDVIFTDLEMPRLNGYELITELRGNPAWAALPVLVISSRGADKYITKAMNLGATTFLTKPFTPEQLEQVLRHYANWDGTHRCRIEQALPA